MTVASEVSADLVVLVDIQQKQPSALEMAVTVVMVIGGGGGGGGGAGGNSCSTSKDFPLIPTSDDLDAGLLNGRGGRGGTRPNDGGNGVNGDNGDQNW